MIPDEVFNQLLSEYSSDPVHDYMLKTFSSSPLKPGETQFFYAPLGLNTFTLFDQQREKIAALRLHKSIPSFTEDFMTRPEMFAGNTQLASQLLTSFSHTNRLAQDDHSTVQVVEAVAALLDIIGTQQPWQALQLYHGQDQNERDFFLLQTGIVPLVALARDLANDHEILPQDAELAHTESSATFAKYVTDITAALAQRWFSESVPTRMLVTNIHAAWPYVMLETPQGPRNAPLDKDTFVTAQHPNINVAHAQILLPLTFVNH